jgi:tetratricopeptide (TPR) repeat protein
MAVATACASNPDEVKRELLRKGQAYAAQKQYPEAIIEFKKAAQQDTRFAEAYYGLGEAYVASGDLKNALLAYSRAADLAPDNVDANLKTGNLMLLSRHFEDAKTRARGILVKDPNNLQALVLLGNALAGLRSLDDAVDVAKRAADLDPDRAGLHTNLGVLELANGNVDQAETAFKTAAATDPTAIKPLLALANFYQSVNRMNDAETTLRKALTIQPRHAGANQTLGLLLIATGRPMQAEPFIETASEVVGTVEAQLTLADYYLAIGKVDESLALLGKVSATTEGYAAGQIRTAMINYASGNRDQAHAILRDVLTKDPKNASALAIEGRILLADHRVTEALALANSALAADQRNVQAYVTLGYVQLARGDREAARKAFAEALNYDARNSTRRSTTPKRELRKLRPAWRPTWRWCAASPPGPTTCPVRRQKSRHCSPAIPRRRRCGRSKASIS